MPGLRSHRARDAADPQRQLEGAPRRLVEEDHEQFLHTLGNLTLTSYNTELSNAPYSEKKKLFATSHVELNRHFEAVERWTATEVEHRSDVLTDIALSLWPYFGVPQGEAEADHGGPSRDGEGSAIAPGSRPGDAGDSRGST